VGTTALATVNVVVASATVVAVSVEPAELQLARKTVVTARL